MNPLRRCPSRVRASLEVGALSMFQPWRSAPPRRQPKADDAPRRPAVESRVVNVTAAPAADVPATRSRLKRLLVFGAVLVVIGAAAQLLGWNVRSWLDELWDTMTGISAGYIVAGVALKTVQTTL